MTVGEKIKRIREFRNLTQKDLGLALDYPANSAATRIGQYETNQRSPKKDTIIRISKCLHCHEDALLNSEDIPVRAGRAMEELFWMEATWGKFVLFPIKENLPNQFNETEMIKGICNLDKYYPSSTAIALGPMSNFALRSFIEEWGQINYKVWSGKISEEQYFEWKIQWPKSRTILYQNSNIE